MIAESVIRLEKENQELKDTVVELKAKLEQSAAGKPESCQHCKYFARHYVRNENGTYTQIYTGHCTCGVPISKGRKKNPGMGETCPLFEAGTRTIRYLGTAE